ncbi:MAG TPA: hypothetical protein VI669_13185 [Vicinamibacteria bacterium]
MNQTPVLLGSALLSALLLAFAFWMGAAYFQVRRVSTHATRLENLLKKSPTVDRVTEGLRMEGSPLLAAPVGPEALLEAAARLGREKQTEVLDKGKRWPITRIFRAGDMVYFLYFDEAGVMRDYSFVSA